MEEEHSLSLRPPHFHSTHMALLTCQFLPDRLHLPQKEVVVQRLLLGTQTDGSERNYLMLAEIKLPSDDAVIDAEAFAKQEADHERVVDGTVGTSPDVGGWGAKGKSAKVEVVQKIPHPSEVNRARYMPQNPDVIVSRGVEGDLYLFDRTRYASQPCEEGWRCDVRLRGHQSEGYGMVWNGMVEGRLLSCANDGRLCLWDIQGTSTAVKALPPTSTWTSAHGTAAINDVTWHSMHTHLFASCGDDALVKCWDARESRSTPTLTFTGHQGPVNSVDYNPLSAHTLATASDDHTVAVWDMRHSASPLHTLRNHHDSVIQVVWAPFDDHVLGSISADRRVNVYDLSRGGGGEEGDELLFMHGGHTDKVGEMSWNGVEEEAWMIASVADNNILQIWQMAANIRDEESEGEGEGGEREAEVDTREEVAAVKKAKTENVVEEGTAEIEGEEVTTEMVEDGKKKNKETEEKEEEVNGKTE